MIPRPLYRTFVEKGCALRNQQICEQFRHQKGFTLAEVIISITVLAVSFTALISLLLSSIQANRANINELVAYNLAQEGIESMRNIRDSHWLSNLPWIGSSQPTLAQAGNYFGHEYSSGNIAFYRVSYNTLYDPKSASGDPTKYNPWFFEQVNASDVSGRDDVLALYNVSSFGNMYVHDVLSCSDCTPERKSQYFRHIEVQFIGDAYDPSVKHARVKSVVRWIEKSRDRSVELSTLLTDWKGGPL